MLQRALVEPQGIASAGGGVSPRKQGGGLEYADLRTPPKRAASDGRKRLCAGKCMQYRAKKPVAGGRYEAGHGRCQTCDIWIDHRGCHMNDGRPAAKDSIGWYCNCCNFRIRRNPRSAEYKQKLRNSPGPRPGVRAAAGSEGDGGGTGGGGDGGSSGKGSGSSGTGGGGDGGSSGKGSGSSGKGSGSSGKGSGSSGKGSGSSGTSGGGAKGSGSSGKGGSSSGKGGGRSKAKAREPTAIEIDLRYFDKRRARMLRDLGRALAISGEDAPELDDELVETVEGEFGTPVAEVVELARSEFPNKASLIAELERIRRELGQVPTRQEMKKGGARFPLSAYDSEFESWGHLLERLGYDPWYRH